MAIGVSWGEDKWETLPGAQDCLPGASTHFIQPFKTRF